MRIGYVLDDSLDKPDGVQQAVITIGEQMRTRGHDVHYLVAQSVRTDLQNIHSLSRTIQLKFNGNTVRTPLPASKRKIKLLLDELQFDVLHVQMPFSTLLGGRVITHASTQTKIFGTFHILPYGRLSRIATYVLGLISMPYKQYFNAVFAVSEPAVQYMKESFRLSGSVIPNPVDLSLYKANTSKAHTKSSGLTRIVFVGRFDERKGVRQLVSAIGKLDRDTRQKIEVILCGKGPLLEDVTSLANMQNLPIVFPGFVSEEEKISYLAQADIAVFPSIAGESFGIVLAEAMAAGAGVTLGGDNPGYRSVLGDWPETLCNAKDTDALAKLINTFIVDSTLRRRIGSAQHEFVKKFDVQVICDELEQQYMRS